MQELNGAPDALCEHAVGKASGDANQKAAVRRDIGNERVTAHGNHRVDCCDGDVSGGGRGGEINGAHGCDDASAAQIEERRAAGDSKEREDSE